MNHTAPTRAWRGYVGLSLVWLAILGGVLFLTRRPTVQPIEILPPPTPAATATPQPTPTPGPVRVDVAGAVHAPGVYTLPPGSIISDAIAAAGGATDDAALDRVNKALTLQEGMQVYVPRISEAAPPLLSNPAAGATSAPTADDPGAPAALVNINTATPAELDTLPGVGPSTAQRIIDGRPYGKIEDLMRVKGIGQATFDKLKDHVTVQ